MILGPRRAAAPSIAKSLERRPGAWANVHIQHTGDAVQNEQGPHPRLPQQLPVVPRGLKLHVNCSLLGDERLGVSPNVNFKDHCESPVTLTSAHNDYVKAPYPTLNFFEVSLSRGPAWTSNTARSSMGFTWGASTEWTRSPATASPNCSRAPLRSNSPIRTATRPSSKLNESVLHSLVGQATRSDGKKPACAESVRLLELGARTLRALDRPTKRSQFIQTNLTREGFAAASAAIVEWDRPANVRVSPDESVIMVDEVPLVECMSSAARSADWLIPAFR